MGIRLDLQSFDSDIFFASYADDGPSANFSLDIIEYSDSPDFPDPDTVVWRCSEIPSDENPAGVNTTGLCDEELEALFRQAGNPGRLRRAPGRPSTRSPSASSIRPTGSACGRTRTCSASATGCRM